MYRPQQTRGRGRGRGGGTRGKAAKNLPRDRQAGQVASSPGMGGQTIRVRDAETRAPTKATYLAIPFSPAKTGLVRLDGFGAMYQQYTIHSVSVAWVSQAATTQSGVVSFGVSPGVAKYDTHDKIQKLRPMRSNALWKSESITLGKGIMQQTWMYCDNITDKDGAAFTIHCLADEALGYLKVTYDVELRYPHP